MNQKIHFIAMSGDIGCIPDSCHAFTNRNDAIQYLIDALELSPHGKKTTHLRKFGYTDLEKYTFGAEYASITKCDCNDMKIHNDD